MKGHPMKTMCALALVLAFAFACAPKVNDPADVQAIKDLMDGYFKAASAKDPAGLDAVLTDKTLLLEPHTAALVGKDAIGKLHAAFLAGFDTDAKGPATEVRVAGDLAVAYGRYAETITPKDGTLAAEHATGHWIAALGRQADGAWKWDSVVANSDQPMPGTTADGVEEQAIAKIEQEWVENADGEVMTRAQGLAAIKGGAFKLESAKLRDLNVHVFGDVAIATMTADVKGTFMGKAMPPLQRSTDFFVKRDGRWQAISTQNTTIKQ
jgi:uncharacterized protein (TIGR02246 family)